MHFWSINLFRWSMYLQTCCFIVALFNLDPFKAVKEFLVIRMAFIVIIDIAFVFTYKLYCKCWSVLAN